MVLRDSSRNIQWFYGTRPVIVDDSVIHCVLKEPVPQFTVVLRNWSRNKGWFYGTSPVISVGLKEMAL